MRFLLLSFVSGFTVYYMNKWFNNPHTQKYILDTDDNNIQEILDDIKNLIYI